MGGEKISETSTRSSHIQKKGPLVYKRGWGTPKVYLRKRETQTKGSYRWPEEKRGKKGIRIKRLTWGKIIGGAFGAIRRVVSERNL